MLLSLKGGCLSQGESEARRSLRHFVGTGAEPLQKSPRKTIIGLYKIRLHVCVDKPGVVRLLRDTHRLSLDESKSLQS
jgi:hypothetical protein